MKPERFMDAMGHLDGDLIEQAERHSAPTSGKRRPKRLLTWAACIALVLVIGISGAVATGGFDSLKFYFGGETESYLDEILSAVTSVSNDQMELRVDGAIADEHTCHMVVSFVGLTDEAKHRFTAGSLEEQGSFQPYAITKDGQRVEYPSWQSGTYTKMSGLGKTAKTMFADADMTYLITLFFEDDITMSDIEKICFPYEDLTLEVNVQSYIAPEYVLTPEDPAESTITDFHISRIGFCFTMPAEDTFDLKLIRADGTVVEEEEREFGYSGSSGCSDEATVSRVSGYWCDGSPISIVIIDLEDYCGAQVNGENYYFTEATA